MRIIALSIMILAASLAHAVEFPQQVAHLNDLVSDEAALVAAIREYDQKELEYLGSLRGQLNPAIAEEKALIEEAHTRILLLREVYEIALAVYPRNPRLNNYLGELQYDYLQEQAGAIVHWKKALQSDPDYANVYNNLGIHYFHIGQYSRGLEALDNAIRLDRKHPDFLFNMVQMYLSHWKDIGEIRGWSNKKIYREAMKLSKEVTKLLPDEFEVHQDYANNFYAGESLEVKVNWRDAAKAWEDARRLAKTPDQQFYTWINEGRTRLRDGDKERARAALEQALKIHPDSPVVKELMERL